MPFVIAFRVNAFFVNMFSLISVAIGSAVKVEAKTDISRKEHPLCQLYLLFQESHVLMAKLTFSTEPVRN